MAGKMTGNVVVDREPDEVLLQSEEKWNSDGTPPKRPVKQAVRPERCMDCNWKTADLYPFTRWNAMNTPHTVYICEVCIHQQEPRDSNLAYATNMLLKEMRRK